MEIIIIAVTIAIIVSVALTSSLLYMRQQSHWEMGYLSGWSDAKRFYKEHPDE